MARLTQRATVATVCAVLFLTFLDTTIVSVTLESVQTSLQAGVVSLQWVVNAYTLVFASLMLLAGSLGDRWGHRRVMLIGIAIFCLGSVVAARAATPDHLIVGRAIMGIGAAGSEPGTLAVLRQVFPDARERAQAIGVWAAVSGLALAMGPVIGGLLVGEWSWAAVFWFNLIVGAVLLVAVLRFVPETRDHRGGRLDIGGFVLSAGFLACVIYAGISGESSGYDAWWVILLFVIGGLCLVGFALVERAVENPILDMAYLRIPIVRSALVVAFAVYFGIFSIFFFTALYLEEVVGYSSWKVAALFAPMAIAIIVAALFTGGWIGWARARIPMITGCVVSAVGILLTRALLSTSPHVVPLAITLAVAGFGFGMAVVPLTAAVIGYTPADHAGMAAAMTNTIRQVGAVVGVAALGGLVNSHLTTDLTDKLRALGVPSGFQALIINAIESGTVPSNGDPAAQQTYGKTVVHVIQATYAAFRDGLREALLISAVLMLVAAVFTAWSTRRTAQAPTQ
jgi:EmrB/QacA subfamily drug resistance transporter